MRNWLRNRRINFGMTQGEVARSAGMSRSSYSNIENGNRRPKPEGAKRIAMVLDFSWTRFYDELPKMNQNNIESDDFTRKQILN